MLPEQNKNTTSSQFQRTIEWRLTMKNESSNLDLYVLTVSQRDELLNYLRDHKPNKEIYKGQANAHLLTQMYIQKNWDLFTQTVLPENKNFIPEFSPFCFTEAIFTSSKPPKSELSIDCFGVDRNGFVFVVEIGTNKKGPQLRRQMAAVQNTFSFCQPIGLTAYYNRTRRGNFRIDLALINV